MVQVMMFRHEGKGRKEARKKEESRKREPTRKSRRRKRENPERRKTKREPHCTDRTPAPHEMLGVDLAVFDESAAGKTLRRSWP